MGEIKSPRVSIGMPVYNGERYIRQALDTLVAQTFTDFELIISDNAIFFAIFGILICMLVIANIIGNQKTKKKTIGLISTPTESNDL